MLECGLEFLLLRFDGWLLGCCVVLLSYFRCTLRRKDGEKECINEPPFEVDCINMCERFAFGMSVCEGAVPNMFRGF